MPSANERKALWFLAFVALSGSGVRCWQARTPPASAEHTAGLSRQIARVDSARAAGEGKAGRRARRPARVDSAAPGPIDLDRATIAEIERLPGIGPALARRIVTHRDSAGPFGNIDAVCAVRGVGPALADRLRPLVTFSGPYRPVSVACGAASKPHGRTRRARP